MLISVVSCSIAYGVSNYVEERGGVVLKRVNNYTLGNVIRFDKKGNPEKYVISGFSIPEELYTWTDGNEASLEFDIGRDIDEDLDLEYSCNIFGLEQHIDIYVNGNYLQSDTYIGEDIHHVIIPKEVLNGEMLDLKFILGGACSPASVGQGTDNRKLALAMEYLVIKRAK